ncbi:MAG: NADH-quinone oxidoreductase subunit H [Lentisphaeria bacterium]|nr:NADH-quinone oxidoreductase subunit H [Lentisphaeria bacterium]
MFDWILHFILMLIAAPLLPGIINKVKAFFAGRKGPSVFQLYYDLFKLVRKECIVTHTSGGVLALAPCLTLATTLVAACFLPHADSLSPLAFTGDAILFFYLLGLGRFITALGALDTGSSFEGMGASREMQFSAMVEGAVFCIIGFMAVLTKECNLSLSAATVTPGVLHIVSSLLTAGAFFVVLLAENSRVPVDDPETHLELTMIHEAMVLDYAGPDMALILYGSALKLWIFAAFFVLLIPGVGGTLWALPGILLTVVLVGILESCMARYRFLKVPQMLFGALAVALLGLCFLIFFEGGAA